MPTITVRHSETPRYLKTLATAVAFVFCVGSFGLLSGCSDYEADLHVAQQQYTQLETRFGIEISTDSQAAIPLLCKRPAITG